MNETVDLEAREGRATDLSARRAYSTLARLHTRGQIEADEELQKDGSLRGVYRIPCSRARR